MSNQRKHHTPEQIVRKTWLSKFSSRGRQNRGWCVSWTRGHWATYCRWRN